MNFIPENDYEGLLAQAKAMHRIIEAMEKSKSIQGKAVDDLTRQLLICGKDHLESEREANLMLTDQVLRLEQERDDLKTHNADLQRYNVGLAISEADLKAELQQYRNIHPDDKDVRGEITRLRKLRQKAQVTK